MGDAKRTSYQLIDYQSRGRIGGLINSCVFYVETYAFIPDLIEVAKNTWGSASVYVIVRKSVFYGHFVRAALVYAHTVDHQVCVQKDRSLFL